MRTRLPISLWARAGLAVSPLLLGACPGPSCEPEATRCNGNTAEVCDAEGFWQEITDCDEVVPGTWTCCETPDGATCLTVCEP